MIDSSSKTSPPQIPDHEMIRQIGRGSYGDVWLARNIMGQFRAVKIVSRDRFDSDRPYEREFSGIQKFEPVSRRHESQLDLLHVGRNDDYFYYVMELADDVTTGEEIDPDHYAPHTLRHDILHRGRLPFAECLEVALALTTALKHLHGNGLVHRDIKPSNVIFVNGLPKLADIGLVADVDATLSLVGTEGYIPPEGPGQPAADIYSLGKVIYEISTGHDRKDFPELPTNLLASDDLDNLSELNEVVVKACEANAQKRYPTADAMREDLVLLQSQKSVIARRRMRRGLIQLRRLGIASTLVALLGLIGFAWQGRQTRQVTRLNTELETTIRESNSRLNLLYEKEIQESMDDRDFAQSLEWSVEALNLQHELGQDESAERARIRWFKKQLHELIAAFDHDSEAVDASFSPNGDQVAVATKDGSVSVWDLSSGELSFPVLKHNEWVNSVNYSSDGSRILTASDDHTARIWDAESGNPVGLPLTHGLNVHDAEFSPDGKWVATASADKTARIWNAADGTPVGDSLVHTNVLLHVTFSPDGEHILTGTGYPSHYPEYAGGGDAQVWSVSDSRNVTEPIHSPYPVFSSAFSPESESFIVSNGFSKTGIRLEIASTWIRSIKEGLPISKRLAHDGFVLHVAYSPDGSSVLTCSDDYTAKIWSTKLDSHSMELKHDDAVLYGCFSPNGQEIATASIDGTVRIWNAVTGESIGTRLLHSDPVRKVRFDADGRRLLTVSGTVIRIWELNWSNGVQPFSSDGQRITQTLFYNGHSNLVVAAGNQATAFDTRTGKELFAMPFDYQTYSGAIHPSGTSFAGGVALHTFTVAQPSTYSALWNMENGERIGSRMIHDGDVWTIAFDPTGKSYASVSKEETLRVFDAANGEMLFPPVHPTVEGKIRGYAWLVAYSPNGELIATTSRNGFRVFDSKNGEYRSNLLELPHDTHISSIQFSPNNRFVLTTTLAGDVTIWNIEHHGSQMRTWNHGAAKVSVSQGIWHPSGESVITAGDDKNVRIWNARSGEEIGDGMPHKSAVKEMAVDATFNRLVAGCQNGEVVLWDFPNRRRLFPVGSHSSWVTSLDLSDDGEWLISGGEGGQVFVTNLSTDDSNVSELKEFYRGYLQGERERASPSGNRLHDDEAINLIKFHEAKLEEYDLPQKMFVPLFHLDRLLELSRDNSGYLERRRRVLTRVPPPRDEDTPPELIDLSRYYNANLHESSEGTRGGGIAVGNNLAQLSPGTHIFDQVHFDARGIIKIGAEQNFEAIQKYFRYPPSVAEIQIDQSAKKIHFLHAAASPARGDPGRGESATGGEQIGQYIVNYPNGEKRVIPLVLDVNISDWWASSEMGSETPADLPRAKTVWTGGNEASGYHMLLRLFKYTWTNPDPDNVIESIDFESAQIRTTPFLVAITVEP